MNDSAGILSSVAPRLNWMRSGERLDLFERYNARAVTFDARG
jgi:hypothetical protein